MSKILVSVDDKLLARIDNAARSAGLTRSAYLSRLAERDLGNLGPGVNRHVQRAIAELQELFNTQPGGESATPTIRSDRDAH
ncbi:hypothetical protein [Ferrimicrobium sp.]|uniref:hypothetical protein n=1 Tax=Ferrimicrobium sp. TaxID=2926050 RepID=UPI002602F4E0|nr:hypothetical protein [Ferrimicrobium sp.]